MPKAKASALFDEIADLVDDVKQKEAARDEAAKVYHEAVGVHRDAVVRLTAKQSELNDMLGGVIGAVDSKVRIG